MEGERKLPAARRREIDLRLKQIQARLRELSQAPGAGREPGRLGDRLAAAKRHAAASEKTARQAAVLCAASFRNAALAHEHAAAAHEQAAAAELGDVDEHQRLAAAHRDAAAADRQQAGRAKSLTSDNDPEGDSGGQGITPAGPGRPSWVNAWSRWFHTAAIWAFAQRGRR